MAHGPGASVCRGVIHIETGCRQACARPASRPLSMSISTALRRRVIGNRLPSRIWTSPKEKPPPYGPASCVRSCAMSAKLATANYGSRARCARTSMSACASPGGANLGTRTETNECQLDGASFRPVTFEIWKPSVRVDLIRGTAARGPENRLFDPNRMKPAVRCASRGKMRMIIPLFFPDPDPFCRGTWKDLEFHLRLQGPGLPGKNWPERKKPAARL